MRINDMAPREVVNDLFVEACRELFQAYGLTAELIVENAEQRRRTGYVSVVSATGNGIRLLSIAAIDATLLARTHHLGIEIAQSYLEDWCRELNNQLVGRVKNKLLEFGCEVITGLPALIKGTDMIALRHPESESRRYVFATIHGGLTLTLEAVLAADFRLADGMSAAEAGPVMHAGAVLF